MSWSQTQAVRRFRRAAAFTSTNCDLRDLRQNRLAATAHCHADAAETEQHHRPGSRLRNCARTCLVDRVLLEQEDTDARAGARSRCVAAREHGGSASADADCVDDFTGV